MSNETQKPQTLEEKIEAIREQGIQEKMSLLKSTVESQGDRLKADMKHLIKKTLCDKTYPNALNKKDIEITSLDFDYDTLECIVSDTDLADSTSVLLLALFTVNGQAIRLGAWVGIDYDMKLNEADFNLGTDCNDIDCNLNHGNMIKEILATIKEVA